LVGFKLLSHANIIEAAQALYEGHDVKEISRSEAGAGYSGLAKLDHDFRSDWEFHYPRKRGQPPIHPKQVAGAILYGMYRGIRSSRRLEDACNYRFDFIWLVEGRRIDHTTFNRFRSRFREPLKNLFKQIGRIAMALGVIRLGEVAFDGTRVKASNARFQTRTAKTLQQKLQALDELFDNLMARLNATDAEEAGLGSSTHLPDTTNVLGLRRRRLGSSSW
jgi:transposase